MTSQLGSSRFRQLREYYDKNEHRLAIVFFVIGFLFDILMIERIDSWMMIGQQAAYIFIVLAVLMKMFFEEFKPPITTDGMFFLKRWYYDYRAPLIHFLLGTLLNLYTIFFFKSSSLLVSFGFLIFMIFLLWANESHRLRSYGLAFKFALLSVCSLSYAALVVPVFIGQLGLLVFLFSMLLGCIPLVGVGWWVQTYASHAFEKAKSQILLPLGFVLILFLSLYLFKLIPPVPLSIPFIGVYHSVEKEKEEYKLGHERPWWRFWHHGDQWFTAQKSDKIFVFFRIFSPTRFSDQVLVKWYWKDNRLGWTLQDSIPIRIQGGREEGFRGFGVKSNYQPGAWKVQIETTDEREIGRIYFNLEIGEPQPRTFMYDLM